MTQLYYRVHLILANLAIVYPCTCKIIIEKKTKKKTARAIGQHRRCSTALVRVLVCAVN